MTKKLTIIERQILSNQFRILENLTSTGEGYGIKAEILERGITGKYDQIFTVFNDELPLEICTETEDILRMYNKINDAIASLNEEEKIKLNLEKLKFEGFDDPHYIYADFIISEMGLRIDCKGKIKNISSLEPLIKYRKMLPISKSFLKDDKYNFNKSDLEQLINELQ